MMKDGDECKDCTFQPEILRTRPDYEVGGYVDKATKNYYERQVKAKQKKDEIEDKLKPKCIYYVI